MAADMASFETTFRDIFTRVALQWPYIDRVYVSGTQGNIDRWPQCAVLVPQVSTLSREYLQLKRGGSLLDLDLDLVELLCEASAYLIERSQSTEAASLLDNAASILNAVQGVPGLTEYQLRIYRGRIGVAFIDRDEEGYMKYAKLSWDIETELYRKSKQASSRLAVVYHQMGIAHNLKALYSEAIPYLEISERVRRSLPGFTKDWLFTPYYQLAHAYFHRGEDGKAAELLETAIKDRIEVLGENDRVSMRTGALYYTLGDVKYHQGLFDQSLALHTKAYIHLKATAGPTNLGTLHCEYKLAAHMARLRDPETASIHLDHVFHHYRLTDCARPYICRAALLYSDCLKAEGKDHHEMLKEAVEVFNGFSNDHRTVHSLTETDASSLISYDYL